MKGYIKDYRKELYSDIWLMPPLYHRVWQWLKYQVNHEPNEIPMRDGTKMLIKRGQRLTSIRDLAKSIGWYEGTKWKEPNPKTVSTILEWLEKQEMIIIERGKGDKQYTLIEIKNWKIYQEKSFRGNSGEKGGGNSKVTPSNPYGSKDYILPNMPEGNSDGGNSKVTLGSVGASAFIGSGARPGVTPRGEGREHLADINKNDKECLKNEKNNTTPQNREKNLYSEENTYFKMASYFHKKVTAVAKEAGVEHLTKKSNLQKWADEFRLLVEKDKVEDNTQIRNVMDWVTTDDFWKTNILSAKKFREKYADLAIKMKASQNLSETAKLSKTDPRDKEIKLQQWIQEGNDPDEFDWGKQS